VTTQSLSRQLLGTWKLQNLEDLVGGEWVQTFGENPAGYFSFDASGCVSVQFRKDRPAKAYASDEPTAAEALETLDGYLAYFGRYTVDEQAGTFTTVVEGALNPALIGTKQVRRFEIRGERLVVGDQVTYRRFFERA